MRTLKIVVAVLSCLTAIGCGSSHQLATPSSSGVGNQPPYALMSEQQLTPSGRSWSQDLVVPSPILDPAKAYLATLVYEDNQEQLVKVTPQGTTLKLMLSQAKLRDGLYPTKYRLYQLCIDLNTPANMKLVYDGETNRGITDKPFVILVHGIISNTKKMEALEQMINTGVLPNGTPVRQVAFKAYSFEYNDLQPIAKSSEYLWHYIHDRLGTMHKRVILIGHSQGGLVSRHAIERRGMSYDVAQLIMLGTPNNGSSIFGLTTQNLVILGAMTDSLTLLAFAFGLTYLTPAVADLGFGSPFLTDLNQPSHTDVNYHTIAGTRDLFGIMNTDSDGIVGVDSCNWSGLSNEGQWDGGQTISLTHTDLPVSSFSLAMVQHLLEAAYPDNGSTPVSTTTANTNSGSTSSSGGSTSSGTTNTSTTSTSPATTVTQTTLTHPASQWDYGENGFWYREGKWHAAAKRVDVGPPLEAVQIDGRNGTFKSGSSGRGFSFQRCRDGILINLGTDVLAVKGEFYGHYRDHGGPTGELGCLTAEQRYDQRSGVSGRNGEWAQFEGGFIAKFNGLTATVLGDFARVWDSKGKGQGELGYPQDYRRSVKSGAPQFVNTTGGWGQYQPFEGGSIAEWSQTEHVVSGGFDREYRRVGGPAGPLGYPQTAKRTGVRSGCSARYGEEQIFQFGRICELGVNNAWAVYGEILKRYSGPEYHHGFPLGPSENDNHRQRFEEYYISW